MTFDQEVDVLGVDRRVAGGRGGAPGRGAHVAAVAGQALVSYARHAFASCAVLRYCHMAGRRAQ